jgi:hypothetical protein
MEDGMARNTLGIKEADLIVPTLRTARAAPGGKIGTGKLIAVLEALFKPAGKDAALAKNRSDTYFSQKVRNLVSQKTKSNLIGLGYATHYTDPGKTTGGIIITPSGLAFLKSLGI